jgi:hypothetical protein
MSRRGSTRGAHLGLAAEELANPDLDALEDSISLRGDPADAIRADVGDLSFRVTRYECTFHERRRHLYEMIALVRYAPEARSPLDVSAKLNQSLPRATRQKRHPSGVGEEAHR